MLNMKSYSSCSISLPSFSRREDDSSSRVGNTISYEEERTPLRQQSRRSGDDSLPGDNERDASRWSTSLGLAFWTVLAVTAALTAMSRVNLLWGSADGAAGVEADLAAAAIRGIPDLSFPYLASSGVSPVNSPFLGMTYPSDPLPFSTVGPDDMSVMGPGAPRSFQRPRETSPGKVFGSWRRRDPKVGSNQNASQHTKSEGKRSLRALPTSMWYQNLLLGSVNDGILTDHNRAYTIPYIVDFVGPVPGIRAQFPHVMASDTIVQMATVSRHGLTLGSSSVGVDSVYVVDEESPPTQLGLGLVWSSWPQQEDDGIEADVERGRRQNAKPLGTMKSSVLRGMPYITMQYSQGMQPVLAAETPLRGSPVIDGVTNGTMRCGNLKDGEIINADSRGEPAFDVVRVQGEVSLTFEESDFTWLVFFSRPVWVTCYQETPDPNAPPLPPGVVDFTVRSMFQLRVVDPPEDEHQPLIVRAALENNCTSGLNPLYCVNGSPRRQTHLNDLLRAHADVYPSTPQMRYEFPTSALTGNVATYSLIHFDWGARSMRRDTLDAIPFPNKDNNLVWWKAQSSISPEHRQEETSQELLMYALPHHIDSLEMTVGSSNTATGFCSAGLHGQSCLLRGGEWVMKEELDGPPSFAAPRPPHHEAITSMAKALSTDIHFELPEYYMRGAGDTYFSGKLLAKLARIIVIAHELKGLAATPETDSFDLNDPSERELKNIVEVCRSADLPSDDDMTRALTRLRSGVEVWLNGTAEAKFLYDQEWGGLVNCGCLFNAETQSCDNVYPDCPTFSDPGLDFGNGFYNDHHFHYGYHIYAASVVANFDLAWGRQHFQEVLMLIRDIANPSIHDESFPAFRHKDWYLGSSWASGIATLGGQPYLNGRNQESSSEAIHAYESISLYGAVMLRAWGNGISASDAENDNAKTAGRVMDMGRLLTATELRSAQRYWHVLHGDSVTNTVYPLVYKPSVVGMMWDTMAQFQTWFGNKPYLAYGIQLMPLTPVSERRDAVKWVQQMYLPFANSCESDINCKDQGWSVLQYAMLATAGHRKLALQKAMVLPASVFGSAGGNGHSMTNTLWYIATRPDVAEPLVLSPPVSSSEIPPGKPKSLVCNCPETCTPSQKENSAGEGYTCSSRILWLMKSLGKTEEAACRQVGGVEFPFVCGGCDPDRCVKPPSDEKVLPRQKKTDDACPPCSPAICQGETNHCPRSLSAPFLCLSGANKGGCAQTPWRANKEDSGLCANCCKLNESCFGV
mmetsp:Transcript_32036/g.95977  ORF Transcript_32036/g.95977 Transcript_32036/m.95977 type:complete len:1250 (-) Transcript_32036:130-3879(-)